MMKVSYPSHSPTWPGNEVIVVMKVSYPSHSPTQPENEAILIMKASYPSHSPTWPRYEVIPRVHNDIIYIAEALCHFVLLAMLMQEGDCR